MPQVRVVFNTSEIAHLWAHQKVKEARNRQGTFYFFGDTIFSYGSHFPIAKIVQRKGKKVVLFTVREYSQMTSQHKWMTRDACEHMTVLMVPCVSAKHREVLAYYRDQCNQGISYIRGARTGNRAKCTVAHVVEQVGMFKRYAKFFDLASTLSLPSDWKDLVAKADRLSVEQDARDIEIQRKKKLKQEQIEALAREEFSKVIVAWERGEFPTSQLPHVGEIYLRLRAKKLKTRLVETSRGAVVSLEFVQGLWGLIQTARSSKQSISDIEVGRGGKDAQSERLNYRVDRIDADGTVHAGCHHIQWPQIERFAKQLGWLNAEV